MKYQSRQNVSTPQVSIRPNCISLYSLPAHRQIRSDAQKQAQIHLQHNAHKGLISLKAEKRIKNAIDWLLYLSETKSFYNRKYKKHFNFKLCFVTLTLSAEQFHSDNVIKKELLNQFLVEFRTTWKVKHYVWRAEPQKNGNIHFHIVCDKFIPWSDLRNRWNRCQAKLGYIDKFKAKHNHRNPNSTDVHSIQKIKNLSRYLAKYMTKNKQERQIEGNLWGLSQSLSGIESATYERDSWIDSEINQIKSAFAGKVRENDYVTCIYVSVKEWSKVVKGLLYNLFRQYLEVHRQKIKIPIDKMKVSISSSLPPDFGWSEHLVAQPIPIRITPNYQQLKLNWN